MLSNSCGNLYDVGSVEIIDPPRAVRALPRVMTAPSIISDLDGVASSDEDLDSPASVITERKILVANFLPIHSIKDQSTGEWCFTWDEESLLLQLKDGFSSETEVVYVGSLKVDIDVNEQDEVAQKLLEDFRCIPTFLPPELEKKFYHGFCKQILWTLFHDMLPLYIDKGNLFDRSLFKAYISANKIFACKVMEAMNSDDDYVWVHDYHLMLLPTLLRKRLHRVKLGFFLHSPFPSSDIFMIMPFREEILKGLLNADLIGFHTFDYARHFLSCCSRMLNLSYESIRGHLGVEYFGRTVSIKILPVGVHIGRLQSVLNLPATIAKVQEIEEKFKGKKLFLSIDDMDIFKGINLKFLSLELMLESNPKLRGKVVLVQILNPARSAGKQVKEERTEAISTAERINLLYGGPGYQPVVLIDHSVPFYEKIAFYATADCCIVNAVRDGMNLVPYEYIVSRQGTEEMDNGRGNDNTSPHMSTLIVSEFVGCSRSLTGAIKVNPWSVQDVAYALLGAARMTEYERQLHHEKHYRYVSTHHVAFWARSFAQDLERACKDHYSLRCWGVGLGLGFRVIALPPGFRKLSVEHIVASYKRTSRRAIFLDYDGTIVPDSWTDNSPSTEVISTLNTLCSDPKNTVFIVSGRGRTSLGEWFSSCETLGIAAEHGYFIRWSKASEWETSNATVDSYWKKLAEPAMRLYLDATDGSYIEEKETAMVWHHHFSDFLYGASQAKGLVELLNSVLVSEQVVVKRGQQIVEVKPQGVSKGLVVENLLATMVSNGSPVDFVMCIGDDRSDEDMFESINSTTASGLFPDAPEVFACTVGQKPSKAKYYVDDTTEVIKLLKAMAAASTQKQMVKLDG